MAYHEDDEKDKEEGTISEEALGDVLEKDEDEDDDLPASDLLDDEKAWE